jgi:hypothetical protein
MVTRLPQPRRNRIRRERRRRFVAFSGMLADLTLKPLIEPSETPQEPKPSEPSQQR